jgi:hypothetical protein
MNIDVTIARKIQLLYLSCQQALEGSWDRSDDGFIAMADDLEEIMKHFDIVIPEPDPLISGGETDETV